MPTSSDLLHQQNPAWEETIPGLMEIHHATWAPQHMVEESEREGRVVLKRGQGGEIKREQKKGRSEGSWEEIKERRYEFGKGGVKRWRVAVKCRMKQLCDGPGRCWR